MINTQDIIALYLMSKALIILKQESSKLKNKNLDLTLTLDYTWHDFESDKTFLKFREEYILTQ